MKYFVDTEFLEGPQLEMFPISLFRKHSKPTIDLISIGIVAQDGREYYAISKDFNLKEAWSRFQTTEEHKNGNWVIEYWIRENVLKPIFDELNKNHAYPFEYKFLKRLINKYGKTNKEIADEISIFCNPIGDFSRPEFYAYYADYDWVVFCWLFGNMIDLPNGFPMYCKDLKQDFDFYNGNFKKRSQMNALPSYLSKLGIDDYKDHPDYPKQENEHNALADARWNKKLHDFLCGLDGKSDSGQVHIVKSDHPDSIRNFGQVIITSFGSNENEWFKQLYLNSEGINQTDKKMKTQIGMTYAQAKDLALLGEAITREGYSSIWFWDNVNNELMGLNDENKIVSRLALSSESEGATDWTNVKITEEQEAVITKYFKSVKAGKKSFENIEEPPLFVYTFGEAIKAAKEGKRITRGGWNGKGLFVFMQVPSEINKDIVPRMQSLPQSVKDEFQRRFDSPEEQISSIYYSNQLALVNPSNLITGWSPSVSDALAEDWAILD